jgi:O-methyltransferase involved in polyketide biosynthesis
MEPKPKITLTKEQETLLIPLFAKGHGNLLFDDEKARRILDGVQYDFGRLKIPQKTRVTLRIRAKKLDDYTRQFITTHPNALVLHLGCGLDSRCLRVPRAETVWIDLDLPDVIELRRRFYPETETYRLIASSAADLGWLEGISAGGRPVFVVAEGLLMYLKGSEVRDLVVCLHRKFPGGSLAFDAFSRLTAERIRAHPSLQKTGAVVHWGIDDPAEIEGWAGDAVQTIRLVEEWFFSQSPDLDKLDWLYRLAFRLAGAFPAARRAHRLLYYRL